MSSSSSSSGVSSSSSSSSSSPFSVPPSVQTATPAREILKNCIDRINEAVERVKLEISEKKDDLSKITGPVNKITCPISYDDIEVFGVTRCNHIFELVLIKQWVVTHSNCPMCKRSLKVEEITEILKSPERQELIKSLQEKGPIPTCSNFSNLDQNRADAYIALAKSFIEVKNYVEAIECYRIAFQYTKSSEDYAKILPLYEQLKEPEKVMLGRLYLSLYQIQEGKTQKAIETLKQCGSDTLKLDPLLVDLEKSFRSNVISSADWANAKTLNLPPYSQELKDFLEGDCTIWPGKKRSQTHIVVPLFPMVNIDGTPVPLTLVSLWPLDGGSGGPGYTGGSHLPGTPTAEKEFHWGVLTNDVLPGSRGVSRIRDKVKLLPPGYEIPGVFDAARAILWENRRSGNWCFGTESWEPYMPATYTHSREGSMLIVGGLSPSGLRVCPQSGYPCADSIGLAGWRKF